MVNGRCLLGFLRAQLTILTHNCRAGILLNSEQLTRPVGRLIWGLDPIRDS
jgi:hypothetical protein